MSDVRRTSIRAYTNVMEVMVADEVKHQLSQLSPRVLKYIKGVEVETYALNRLPSLYASSEKGWRCQYDKARRAHQAKVADAVRQAIAAVQVDPIRSSQPLPLPQTQEAATILARFKKVLNSPELTWETLLQRLQKMTTARPATKSVAAAANPAAAQAQTQQPEPVASSGNSHKVWRPGTYGETSWQPKKRRPVPPSGQGPNFDWSDSRYR